MRLWRQAEIVARTVKSIIDMAEQVLFTYLAQHIRTHQREHRLSMNVGKK